MSNKIVETLYRLKDGATAVLQRISGGYQSNANAAETSTRKIESANARHKNSLSGVLATVGKLRYGYLVLAGAIVGAVRGFANLAQVASDQENAEARLTTALQNGRGATDAQIEALKELAAERQNATRFSDEQTISAQAQLATFQLTAEQIAKLTPRVLDLAEGTRRLGKDQIDVEQSAILVGKALTGNAGSLSRYGVVLTDLQRETIRLGNDSERVAAIAEALDANYKGLSESLTPYELANRRTANAIGDLGEKIGSFITESPTIQKVINDIGGLVNRMGERFSQSTGTVERFTAGTAAAFKILANTVGVTLNALILGVIRFEQVTLTGVRNIANALTKITFGAASNALESFVSNADKRLAELEQSANNRLDAIGKDAYEFVEAGRELNDVLLNTTEAQKQANEASKEAQELALQQRQAEDAKREALERTQATLEKLGVDAEAIETGISKAARETAAQLQQLAADGEVSLSVIEAAVKEALKSFTTEEINFFRQELKQAADDGVITAQQFERMSGTMEIIQATAQHATTGMESLQKSIKKAGDADSVGALKRAKTELDKLRESGELTEQEFKEMDAQIGQSISNIEAGMQRTSQAAQTMGDSIKNTGQQTQESTEGVRQSVGGLSQSIAIALQSVRDLSEGTAARMDELLLRFNRLNVAGAEPIGAFRDLFGIMSQVTTEFKEQTEEADKLLEKYRETGDASLIMGRATTLLNHKLQLLDTSRVEALESAVKAAREQMDRARESSSDLVDSLTDDLLRLEGKTNELEQRRLDRKREEIKLQLEAAGNDSQTNSNLRKALDLLSKIEAQRKRNVEAAEQSAKASERELESTSKLTNTFKESEADIAERKAAAEEKAAAARQRQAATPVTSTIDVNLRTSGINVGGLQSQDLTELARRLLPQLLREINRQKVTS